MVPHPDPKYKGFPVPSGTGFFVSPSGHFITALHVILGNNGKMLDPKSLTLEQANDDVGDNSDNPEVRGLSLIKAWPTYDLVILKAGKASIPDTKGGHVKDTPFDFLDIEFNTVPIGTEVYSYGYPLPDMPVIMQKDGAPFMAGWNNLCPRLTSAIISSHNSVVGIAMGSKYPQHYVIDKALNYGNSGGAIVVQETGRVISVCQSFQPVAIQQNPQLAITIPSLYGITRSLKNIEGELKEALFVCTTHDFDLVKDDSNMTIVKCKKCGYQKITYK